MGFTFTKKELEVREFLPRPTTKDVYKYVNHYDMFRYYVGDFKLGKPILSPLQREKVPSFSVYARGNQILYNDFRLGGGDIIRFVSKKFNLTYLESVNKIIHDAGLGNKFYTELTTTPKPVIHHNIKIKDTKKIITIKSRKPQQFDIKFWEQFGINEETLKKYRIVPIKAFFLNNKPISADKYAYAFIENKDDVYSYTIYQPYNKVYKWFKSHDNSVFYGWEQLPNKGSTLILSKSMKDVMTINGISGLPVVSLQGESVWPKEHIIDELKARFSTIYVWYDNDYNGTKNWGRQFGQRVADENGLKQIEIPDNIAKAYNAKDPSDLAKNAGINFVRRITDDLPSYIVKEEISDELIKQLQTEQNNPMLHGYSCPGNNELCRTNKYNNGLLIPTKEGWICPCGKYKQDINIRVK